MRYQHCYRLCRKREERSGGISCNAVIVSLRELGPAGGARNEMGDDVVILCAHTWEARHERCEERGAASQRLRSFFS